MGLRVADFARSLIVADCVQFANGGFMHIIRIILWNIELYVLSVSQYIIREYVHIFL